MLEASGNEYRVYMHTSPGGKVYIGVTNRKPEARWKNGFGYKLNEHFYSAICKYGWDNFQHDIILDGLSYDDASNVEIDLIAIHDATNRDCGYNHRYGGNMTAPSEETRQKLSIANMGKKRGPEALANMSKAQTGKKVSPGTRLAMSKAHKARPMTESRRQQLIDCGKKRSVEQLRGNAKLSAEQVIKIRAMHDQGARNIDLAREFGVAPGNISNIIHLRNWVKP